MRWYPPAWLERYGDEFTAHMEDEFFDHPSVPSRTLNVVLHDVLTRFSLCGERFTAGWTLTAVWRDGN